MSREARLWPNDDSGCRSLWHFKNTSAIQAGDCGGPPGPGMLAFQPELGGGTELASHQLVLAPCL